MKDIIKSVAIYWAAILHLIAFTHSKGWSLIASNPAQIDKCFKVLLNSVVVMILWLINQQTLVFSLVNLLRCIKYLYIILIKWIFKHTHASTAVGCSLSNYKTPISRNASFCFSTLIWSNRLYSSFRWPPLVDVLGGKFPMRVPE